MRVNRTKPHRELVSIISRESATDEIHKIRIETAVLPDHCLKRRGIYFLAASGHTESDENANTEELPNHFMALEGNRKLPQHIPQNYRAERSNNNSTAETNEGLRRLTTVFLALAWIFSNEYLAWKACFDFQHTSQTFQSMIKFYVLVGFQATAVTIATVKQSTSFWITSIISKSSQTLGNEPFRI